MKKLLSALLLAGCLACSDDDDTGKTETCIDSSKIKDPLICPDVVKPVCGCDAKTYKNQCEAEGSGVIIWTEGACGS